VWKPWWGKRKWGSAPDRFDRTWSSPDSGGIWLFSVGDRIRGYYGSGRYVVEAIETIAGRPPGL
jgi:hypothetical protein